jgi:hypothetical protein
VLTIKVLNHWFYTKGGFMRAVIRTGALMILCTIAISFSQPCSSGWTAYAGGTWDGYQAWQTVTPVSVTVINVNSNPQAWVMTSLCTTPLELYGDVGNPFTSSTSPQVNQWLLELFYARAHSLPVFFIVVQNPTQPGVWDIAGIQF